jgi:hypothetical protein
LRPSYRAEIRRKALTVRIEIRGELTGITPVMKQVGNASGGTGVVLVMEFGASVALPFRNN